MARLRATLIEAEAERAAAALDDPETALQRAALASAKAERNAIMRDRLADHQAQWERGEAAEAKVLEAERAFAAAQGRPYAVPEDFPLAWQMGAPLPTLLQCDNRARLFFLLERDRGHVGVVTFDRCLSTCFGDPGEESIGRHPLFGSGLDCITASQVIGSPWIAELRRIDSRHQYHDPAVYDQARHYILPFHDTMFECVAWSYSAVKVRGQLHTVIKKAVDRLI